MNENGRAPDRLVGAVDTPGRENAAQRRSRHQKAWAEYETFVQRAIEYEAEHGEWPPDPLLDEVAEMRRQIMAEHDNDWRKVLDWYLELDRQRASTNGHPQSPVAQEQSEA